VNIRFKILSPPWRSCKPREYPVQNLVAPVAFVP
jgi:hypothetical protein